MVELIGDDTTTYMFDIVRFIHQKYFINELSQLSNTSKTHFDGMRVLHAADAIRPGNKIKRWLASHDSR